MKIQQLLEISEEKITLVLFGAISILLCIICYRFFPQSIHEIWAFALKYLGYMAYLLVPMTLLQFSILLHAVFEPLEEGTVWATITQRLEVFFPLVGLLSTFLAIALGLAELNGGEMNTQAILAIAGEICRATWGSILGVSMGMVAYVVHHDLTVAKEEPTEVAQTSTAQQQEDNADHIRHARVRPRPSANVSIIPNNAKS